MRIKIANSWVAGHPDYEPGVWSLATGIPLWLPTRSGDWSGGAGHERLQHEDAGNAAFTLRFSVTRTFATQREVADWITALCSRTPPHPWSGVGTVRYDIPGGGNVEINLGWCVLQMAEPVSSLAGTARLTQTVGYLLHCGVTGAQPVLTNPVDPGQDDEIGYDDYYGG